MSQELERVFDSKHTLADAELERLKPEDVDELRRVVLSDDTPVRRAVAVDALARVAPRRAVRALSRILTEAPAPVEVRAAAAMQLAWLSPRRAETEVLRGLEIDERLLFRIKASAALGRIGTSRSLPALEGLIRPGVPRVLVRQAELGLKLIGFREGSDRYLPQAPTPRNLLRPSRDSLSVVPEATSAEEIDAVLDHLRRDSFGIRLSRTDGARWRCLRCHFAFSINTKLKRSPIKALGHQPMIVGQIAQQAEVDSTWSTRYVLLGWPTDRGKFGFSAYRTDGTMAFFGEGTGSERELAFEMSAVREGAVAPMRMAGGVRGGRVVLDRIDAATRVVGARRPRASFAPAPDSLV